jgi:hypothetical protein
MSHPQIPIPPNVAIKHVGWAEQRLFNYQQRLRTGGDTGMTIN